MKRLFQSVGLMLGIGLLFTAIPANRHALAEAASFTVGSPGAGSLPPTQAVQVMPALPALASVSGTLTNSGDTVVLPIVGAQWATAKTVVGATGNTAVVLEISIDGGTNWILAAYAKRLDAVNANPTVQGFPNTIIAPSTTWEVPLPANCTHFRARCTSSTTPTALTLSGGAPYVPGVPVVAVLYDVASAINTPLDPGTLDTSGWSSLFAFGTKSGGVASFTVQAWDDNGTLMSIAAAQDVSASSNSFLSGWGPGFLIGANGTALSLPLAKRVRYASGAVAAQTTRLRIEARR